MRRTLDLHEQALRDEAPARSTLWEELEQHAHQRWSAWSLVALAILGEVALVVRAWWIRG